MPAPLLPVAAGIMIGIVADYFLAPGPIACVIIATLALTTSLIVSSRPFAATLTICLAAAASGAIRHDLAFRRIAPDHVARFINPHDRPLLTSLRGRVIAAPRIIQPREDIPRAYAIGPKTRILVEAFRLAGINGPLDVSGTVQVTVKAPLPELSEGDLIDLTGWLYHPRPPANPGQFDWALALQRNGIRAAMSCDHAEVVRVIHRATSPGLLTQLRARARACLLDDAIPADDPAAGVIEAMVLGQRGAVTPAMNDVFIRTGNVHFLAASGINVAWLAAFGWGMTRALGLYYRHAAFLIAAMISSFILVAEPEPSILRAGIVGLLACLCVILRGRLNVLNWLACSAIIILLIDPCDLFRAGFQLSFIGVLAVTHGSRVVREIIVQCIGRIAGIWNASPDVTALQDSSPEDSLRSRDEPTLPRLLLDKFLHATAIAACVTAAAWIATAPLAAWHFGRFAPWGILGTLVLSPFAMAVTFVGYVKLLLSSLIPPANALTAPILSVCTASMVQMVTFLSKLPGTWVDASNPSTALLLATYAAMAWRTYRRETMPLRYGFMALAMVLVFWWWTPPRWLLPRDDALRVWMLAVGDGTGTVIELPNGRTLLYDFGTRSPFDAGQLALDFLRWRGIRRIDEALVSHSDFDHFSGIQRIADEIPIGRVVVNDQFLVGLGNKSAAARFISTMQDKAIPVVTLTGYHRFDCSTGAYVETLIEAIWPPGANDRLLRADNDRSMVLRIEHQGGSVLLTGDVTETAMSALMADARIKSDVLALPHHGSVVANTKRFIEAVDPSVAVRSSGQSRWLTTNGIERLVAARRFLSTADVGCVCVTIQQQSINVEAFIKNDVPLNRPVPQSRAAEPHG